MADLFDFDQLNTLKVELEQISLDPAATLEEKTQEAEDALFEFFVDMYFLGVLSSQRDLETDVRPTDKEVEESIFQRVRGEDFRDRAAAYMAAGDVAGLKLVADTVGHRSYGAGA